MKTYPILPGQKENGVLKLSALFTIPKQVDLDRFCQAVHDVIYTNRELRIRFIKENGELRQFFDPELVIPIKRQSCNTNEELYSLIQADYFTPFDLTSGNPLIRINVFEGTENNYFLLSISHSIVDGYSLLAILRKELMAAYNGQPVPKRDYGLLEVAREMEGIEKSEQFREDRKHLFDSVKDAEFLNLSKTYESGPFVNQHRYFDSEVIDNWCRDNGVSTPFLILTAYNISLAKISGKDRFLVEYVTHGRYTRKLRNACGDLVEGLTILTDITDKQTAKELIDNYKGQFLDRLRHRSYNSLYHRHETGTGYTKYCCYNFVTAGESEELLVLEGYEIKGVQNSIPSVAVPPTPLFLNTYYTQGKYDLRVGYNQNQQDEQLMIRLADSIVEITEQIMAKPDITIQELIR